MLAQNIVRTGVPGIKPPVSSFVRLLYTKHNSLLLSSNRSRKPEGYVCMGMPPPLSAVGQDESVRVLGSVLTRATSRLLPAIGRRHAKWNLLS